MARDVFLSHSSKDDQVAAQVCAALEHAGIRVWMAPRDIPPGHDWGGSIIEGINGCRVMVLLFSGRSNGSPQVLREVERAVAKGVDIIPVRLEDVAPAGSMEYFLGTTQWLDAFRPPLAPHLELLAQTVRGLLDGTASGTGRPSSMPVARRKPRRLWIPVVVVAALLVTGVIVYRDRCPPVRMVHLAGALKTHFAAARDAMLQNGKPDFTAVQADIRELLALDPDNGHALYYQGELIRLMRQDLFTPQGCIQSKTAAAQADLSPYENDFYRYLDNVRDLPAGETGGDSGVTICYSRPRGYCPQRTAWIEHLLAIDLLAEAAVTDDVTVRREKLTASLKHAREALRLYPPHGFDQCLPTEAVIAKAEEGLR